MPGLDLVYATRGIGQHAPYLLNARHSGSMPRAVSGNRPLSSTPKTKRSTWHCAATLHFLFSGNLTRLFVLCFSGYSTLVDYIFYGMVQNGAFFYLQGMLVLVPAE
ncbi:hypothetical protein FKM82_002599 [Ascaphus truei]